MSPATTTTPNRENSSRENGPDIALPVAAPAPGAEKAATRTSAPAPAPAVEKAPEPAAAKPPTFFQRHRRPILLVGGVIALLALAYYLHDSYTHEETDDAYVTGHLHNVSARLAANVTEVRVDDNQLVRKDEVLVTLDPSEYIAVAAAAQATLTKAEADLRRQEPLVKINAVSAEQLDAARSTFETDEAELALARLQIQYCTIIAPADGYVGRKNVEVGNRVTAGQTLLVVVQPDVWVVANFKETQLAHMRPGQPVRITVDSIPDKTFTGRVDSFSPATGNEFALLPADNSTGNFTKIVQRVPVKIVFDAASIRNDRLRIRAGESVVVKVALAKPGAAYR